MANITKSLPQIASLTFVGLVLLVSAISKAFEPYGTIQVLQAIGMSARIAAYVTMVIIATELFLGVSLCSRRAGPVVARCAIVMISVYTIYLMALLFMNKPLGCGCGNIFEVFTQARANAAFGILRNAVLIWLLLPTKPTGLLDRTSLKRHDSII